MFLKHNFYAIIWALLMFILCTMPGEKIPNFSLWELFTVDKLAHAIIFAVFIFLLIVGFKKQHAYLTLRFHAKKTAFLIALVYGISLELIQYFFFPSRAGDINDIIANISGCFIGLIAFRWVYGKELF